MWKLHVEKFYLHLDREARDLDFKQPRLKQKIISRVEELVQETDVKAFRELQDLHKI
jgi:hypothetical protein